MVGDPDRMIGPSFDDRTPVLTDDSGTFTVLPDGTRQDLASSEATSGVIGADGRGWLIVNGRLAPIDGAVVDPPVAGTAGAQQAPIAVLLAQGTPPADLPLADAEVGIDGAGRAVVVVDGVMLRVDAGGGTTVLGEYEGSRPTFVGPRIGFVTVRSDGTVDRLPIPS